jgi:hypothetical protein
VEWCGVDCPFFRSQPKQGIDGYDHWCDHPRSPTELSLDGFRSDLEHKRPELCPFEEKGSYAAIPGMILITGGEE